MGSSVIPGLSSGRTMPESAPGRDIALMGANTPFEDFLDRAERLAAEPPVVHVTIPMRDCCELAADVYLPADLPAPAIVEITPYDKENPLLIASEARSYQRHGYAFVAVDVRGRGRSEGNWNAFVHDGPDTYDTIEWTAAREWCDGRVGMTGLSYMGWVQWAGAAERPPHLRCMVSTSAAGRWQEEIPYINGVFQLFFAWWTYRIRGRVTATPGHPPVDWARTLAHLPVEGLGEILGMSGPTWQNMMEHDTLDDFWRSLRIDGRYHRIDVPCLHVTGWYDLEDLTGAFHHYERMVAESPAPDRQVLLVGPWSHLKSRTPDSRYAGHDLGQAAAVDMDAVHRKWFDHWLRGAGDDAFDGGRVRVFETGTNRWRDLSAWPAANRESELHLRFDGTRGGLSEEAAGAGEPSRAYRYDPADPVPTQVDVERYPVADVPLDQTGNERRPDVLTYTTGVLRRRLVVSGRPTLELFGSSDCDDTDWHVKLLDVHPDGRSYKVAQGCLRAACRDSITTPSPLTPDEVYRFVVELWPAHHAFLPGHRLRISITSSDFPWFARNLNRFGRIVAQDSPRIATNRVHHDRHHPSLIRLPLEHTPGTERDASRDALVLHDDR